MKGAICRVRGEIVQCGVSVCQCDDFFRRWNVFSCRCEVNTQKCGEIMICAGKMSASAGKILSVRQKYDPKTGSDAPGGEKMLRAGEK